MHFAQVEVKALAAHVLGTYQLEPVEGQDIVEIGFITAFLPHGVRVRVKPRS
jgi:hypothetical protein